MRVLLWHGWVLEGSGSNVYTAKVAEVLKARGHDVLLVCQEPHPERFPFVDAWGEVGPKGVALGPRRGSAGSGEALILRPEIGSLLPVFVYDEYEGFAEVKPFVDLTPQELHGYLERNVTALRAAFEWHRSEAVVAGHAVPGPVIARRALGAGRYAAKIHGSDLEYAVRVQDRYRDLAAEGLEGARVVTGGSSDVLARTVELVPAVADRIRVVPPGVEVSRFRPAPRKEALERVAADLAADPDTARGRPAALDRRVERALARQDLEDIDAAARTYDQTVPDPGAADRLRLLAASDEPLVGYFGKLIAQKGVEQLLGALPLLPPATRALIVGFGLHRERLAALAMALDSGDEEGARWLLEALPADPGLPVAALTQAHGSPPRVDFTGRLDHRYAPGTLAALDVLVVPSLLVEAFGMVAAEAASTGALPLVARHSGLAEVAAGLEGAVGRPGLFSFEPGEGATERLAEGATRLLSLEAAERRELRAAVSAFVASEWTWERTAERLLDAAAGGGRA